MNLTLILFIAAAILLIGLLLWAVRPPRTNLLSPDAVFEALATPRDYYHLPQIMQALQSQDLSFLSERGRPDLRRQLQAERKAIALKFVECLETDYLTLIEASRVLAAMAPEVVGAQEWERLRLSLIFSWKCRLLRWRLAARLKPWNGIAQISDLAGDLSFRLEQATTRIGERAVLASEFPTLLNDGHGKSS